MTSQGKRRLRRIAAAKSHGTTHQALALCVSLLIGGCAPAVSLKETPADFDPMVHVAPELRRIVRGLQIAAAQPPLSPETLATARETHFSPRPLPAPEWIERRIPGPAAAPELRLFVVNAGSPDADRPAVLHIHGGGFVGGSAKASLRGAQELALALNCVVVSVDYRLAPETPYPGALEDNYAALKWLYTHAAELGVDRSRIALMGESAGGGHAAMLAIAARDRAEVPLVFQALIYPMLDDRTGSVRAVSPHIGTLVWTAANNRFGWSSLLGVPAGSREVPHGAVPARVEDLRGLPPTFIGTGSIDLFVQENIEYARRLIEAGVFTELNVVPGAYHGFDVAVSRAAVSRQFKVALYGALARAFGQAGSDLVGRSDDDRK